MKKIELPEILKTVCLEKEVGEEFYIFFPFIYQSIETAYKKENKKCLNM